MTSKDRKIKMGAPCLYEEWDEVKHKNSITAPSVNCNYDCKHCGWNPEETQRRLEEGAWMYDVKGVRHLLFKQCEVDCAT